MNKKYLDSTFLLDYYDSKIQKLIRDRNWKNLNDVERVKQIHNYVRDEIRFGYNVKDNRKASLVLKDGYGQCNTKSILLMALLRATGIECRIHGFFIDKILQKGAMNGLIYKLAPKKILHSYVEVMVQSTWYNLEGFILDKKYLMAIQKKMIPNKDGSFFGYGIATKKFYHPEIDFNSCDTFIQKEGIVEDLGIFDNPDLFLKVYNQNLSLIKGIVYRFIGRKIMNKNINNIRKNSKEEV